MNQFNTGIVFILFMSTCSMNCMQKTYSVVSHNNLPTIDFMASSMTLQQLQELDPGTLTPRSRASCYDRIEDLKDRALGPRTGDPRGDIVPEGFMQRIWTSEEAIAERARLAAKRGERETFSVRSEYHQRPTHGENIDQVQQFSDGALHIPLKEWIDQNKDKIPLMQSQADSPLVRIIKIAGIVLVVWTTTEALLAFKPISFQTWSMPNQMYNNVGFLAKIGHQMLSRPGQGLSVAQHILKKIIHP